MRDSSPYTRVNLRPSHDSDEGPSSPTSNNPPPSPGRVMSASRLVANGLALRHRQARDAIELSETLGFELDASNLALARRPSHDSNVTSNDDDETMPMEQPAGTPRSWRAPKEILSNAYCVVFQCSVFGFLLALKLIAHLPDLGGGYHPFIANWTAEEGIAPRIIAASPPPPIAAMPPAPPATGTPPAPPPNALASALAYCPPWAPALGFGGASVALIMSSIGSAYGTGKAGIGISSIGVEKPELVMKSIIPVVMAGVLGIYGLIIAVIIADGVKPFSASGGTSFSDYSAYSGFAHLAAGLVCGLSGVAAGIAIGIVGDAGVRAVALQPKVYVGMVLILIFAEALGLYGLIVGLILAARTSSDCGA